MAAKFECDSCKEVKDPDEKRGTITLAADGWDSLPHQNPKLVLDLCRTCFDKYHNMFVHITPKLAPFRG